MPLYIQNAQKTSFLLKGLHNISESISTTYKDFAKTALPFWLELELLLSIEDVIACLQLQRPKTTLVDWALLGHVVLIKTPS